jgi:hypothetical protein
MTDRLVRSESATEYFRELVESAMQHQKVAARELTSFYVVNMLTGFIHLDRSAGADDQPLAVTFAKALQAAGIAQRDGLRRVGDLSLFISGFFGRQFESRSRRRRLLHSARGSAYGSLARQASSDTFGDVFDELSEKFSDFVDVLSEVSERSSLTSNSDLLRLYEKWLRTGSRRSGDLLAARGIVPNGSVGSRFIQ